MKKEETFRYLASALILLSAQFSVYSNSSRADNSLTAINSQADYNSPIDYVDTRVGTAMSETKTAGMFGKGSEEHGQTVPAVGVPNGMNMWVAQTQDTEQKCIAPYYYANDRWQGFRNSHWVNGGCTQDYGSMTLFAGGKNLRTAPLSRATKMDRRSEIARPDYYAVNLPEEGVYAEMTGLSRSGIFRFTYSEDGEGTIVVNPNSDEGVGMIEYDPELREIRGRNPIHRIYQGWGEPTGHSGWFVVKLPEDVVVTEYGVFEGDSIIPMQKEISDRSGIGVYLKVKVNKEKPIILKAGSSFTSIDGARRNLETEMSEKDFDAVRAESAAKWNERLSRIEVEGGKDTDRRKFYGSLYRASLLPRVISDVDGSYPVFSGGGRIAKMEDGLDYYDDFSMWDTYRALHPLLTLIEPTMSGEMMQSLVIKGREGGWMPIFPCWNSYTAAMIGDHAAAAIADAAVKGVDNFDLSEAYRYLRQNAFESPATFEEYADGMGRRALKSYLEYGYIPLEDKVAEAFHDEEQTSRTLEYAFDDYALAQIAGLLGEESDKAALLARSKNYRNVIDPALGYANGRHADGSFAAGTDPFTFNDAITEGAPCHYTWYVPQDVEGLKSLLGGDEKFEAKLDSMFTEGRYWHGNEPCHQIVYLFNDVDRHDKTKKWVRHIMDTEYLDTPGGLSGNDDAGQMSAWYVFSAMGFYPVCPSRPEYYLGYPAFDKITLRPEGGKEFVIYKSGNNDSSNGDELAEDKVMINVRELIDKKISHSDIKAGGELVFSEELGVRN